MPRLRIILTLLLVLSAPGVALAGGVQVLEAWYGHGDRVCDATWAVERQCRGRECEVYAGNELCGDPRRGREKTLFVHYACGDRTYSAEIPEYAHGYLSCQRSAARSPYRPEFSQPVRGRRHGGLEVLAASYGTRRRVCDATPAVYDECAGRANCAVPAINALCGDPDRGRRKSLLVEYRCGNRVQTARASEDHEAWLTCR